MQTTNSGPRLAGGARATLAACFLYFDLSFMLWVLLGALGIPLAEAAHLTASQKGLVVALPVLTGSVLRVPTEWTDLRTPDGYGDVARGRSRFRLPDLLRLAETVRLVLREGEL